MKFVSWNVNGIRAGLRKDLREIFTNFDADIFCIQETKARPEQVELDKIPEFKNYYQYWNSAEKKGYSGTLILSKEKPKKVENDMGIAQHDREGRIICADFGDFFLINVYTPNSGDKLVRLEYRQLWDEAFLNFINQKRQQKPVLVCGDLNVAHKEIDLARPAQNRFNAGFTDEERAGFDNLIDANWADLFRQFNQQPGQYTWWSYRARAREKNIGWRIDYWLASEKILNNIKHTEIHPQIFGSDHCPVSINYE